LVESLTIYSGRDGKRRPTFPSDGGGKERKTLWRERRKGRAAFAYGDKKRRGVPP